MRILIAEDESTTALLVHRLLSDAGQQPFVVRNGEEAVQAFKSKYFDILLTAWMTPGLNGLQLIRHVRTTVFPVPLIVMMTSVDSIDARDSAMSAGADEYLVKPINAMTLKRVVDSTVVRQLQPIPIIAPCPPVSSRSSFVAPAFVVVAIASSTGGPEALEVVLKGLNHPCAAAIVVVQHGPAWMMNTLCKRLSRATGQEVQVACHGARLMPGVVYIAPGGRHLVVDTERRFQFTDAPPENDVRPAADPLFRSLARSFGRHCVAVVLTGLGRDGALGAERVKAAGGHVIAQDPATATARYMPEAVVALKLVDRAYSLSAIAAELNRQIKNRKSKRHDFSNSTLRATDEQSPVKPLGVALKK